MGVFYADGWQEKWEGHRFCEPETLQYLQTPIGSQTWLWHMLSPDGDDDLKARDEMTAPTNITQKVLERVIEDPVVREAVAEGSSPWDGVMKVLRAGD